MRPVEKRRGGVGPAIEKAQRSHRLCWRTAPFCSAGECEEPEKHHDHHGDGTPRVDPHAVRATHGHSFSRFTVAFSKRCSLLLGEKKGFSVRQKTGEKKKACPPATAHAGPGNTT
ncbi:hypothetical protein TRSC58_07551 [Trypanosoma rangeli SC58]|uniref:Uncharacterized protein n=1 Tax=Trypanosoma rangeli SC58 TaxID=429131 RepID=A0A061IRV3_TRYRA|nr:hypothetical protein TRSC58_07551 [Trypanosoma rangeli SC58]